MRRGTLATVAVVVALGVMAWLLVRNGRESAGGSAGSADSPPAFDSATWVGRESCVECHRAEVEAWRGSHHDLAMQPAGQDTVLGDFDNATFTYGEVTSTFFRRDGQFFVETDGPGGELHEYPIAYTFGVEPLQQYLIEFPGGRLQALNVCWDTRPAAEGGERWFHLYPDETVDHADILHWTGLYQNWNYMCAECHSTNVDKGYVEAEKSYETTWSEIDVSCEACHGPGSKHVESARKARGDGAPFPTALAAYGLVVDLGNDTAGSWQFQDGSPNAERSAPRTTHREVEACGRCHARRTPIADYDYGQPLADTHRVALLDPLLYHPDGQILEEVYVYGSFLQSKMYRAGVTCSDCHDPHTLELRASGNGVCASCHSAAIYDDPDHHHHPVGSEGASCVECHMPPKTYMVVDPRHDHSFRVPRPDLSVELGVPNACTDCHQESSAEWAKATVTEWYGNSVFDRPEYARALDAGRRALPGAERQLLNVIQDRQMPAIAQASALALLPRVASELSLDAVRQSLSDGDPLVRFGALQAIASPPASRPELLIPLLQDPVRTVRTEAARHLAPEPQEQLGANQRADLELALDELRRSHRINSDRPEAHLSLGSLHAQRGELDAAEVEYLAAIDLEPRFPATYVNLADLYRAQGRHPEGEQVLRRGLELSPQNPTLTHALGLALVRSGKRQEATELLAEAARLAPEDPRFSYVYAVALDGEGQHQRAIEVLEEAHRRHPGDRELLIALVTILRDRGEYERAIVYADRLLQLAPGDRAVRQLREQLGQSEPRPESPFPAHR